jgi:hypothetical protein
MVFVLPKEVNKEQPSYRNLSATATRVLQLQLLGKIVRLLGNYVVNITEYIFS